MIQTDWLTLREACEYLKCSPKTLIGKVREGEIHGTKRLGRWRVSRSSIDEFMSEERKVLDLITKVQTRF